MSKECKELGIPDYLHQNDRPEDPEFNSEQIYRRFNVSGKIEDWKKGTNLSASIFPVKQDSCVREKYCRQPTDVLFNTRPQDEGAHYNHFGILQFNTDSFEEFKGNINNEKRVFKLKMQHSPLECMYPHSEIEVTENGKVVSKPPPKSIRTLVRDYLLNKIDIIQYPEEN